MKTMERIHHRIKSIIKLCEKADEDLQKIYLKTGHGGKKYKEDDYVTLDWEDAQSMITMISCALEHLYSFEDFLDRHELLGKKK